jgi:hypothetical protein
MKNCFHTADFRLLGASPSGFSSCGLLFYFSQYCGIILTHYPQFDNGYFHFAMVAGVTDRLWSVEDLVALWEAYEERRAERAA